MPAAAPVFVPATEPQIKFLAALRAEAVELGLLTAAEIEEDCEYFIELSKAVASKAIGQQKADNAKARQTQRVAKPKVAPVTEGMYVVGEPGSEKIYKVQRAVHGSGNLYAKVLVVEGKGNARFEFAPGMVWKLTAENKMDLATAQGYGDLYGICVRCAAILTAEDSIERMMGPVCITYM